MRQYIQLFYSLKLIEKPNHNTNNVFLAQNISRNENVWQQIAYRSRERNKYNYAACISYTIMKWLSNKRDKIGIIKDNTKESRILERKIKNKVNLELLTTAENNFFWQLYKGHLLRLFWT